MTFLEWLKLTAALELIPISMLLFQIGTMRGVKCERARWLRSADDGYHAPVPAGGKLYCVVEEADYCRLCVGVKLVERKRVLNDDNDC